MPIYYDYLASGRTTDPGKVYDNGTIDFGHQYVEGTPQPLYEFGYGLSYANFSYSNVTVSASKLEANDTITATVQVTNSGSMDGKEVTAAWIADAKH